MGYWSASEEIADIEVVFCLISYFACLSPIKVAFATFGIVFVKVMSFIVGFEFVPLAFRISGNFDQNIIVRYSIYAMQRLSNGIVI